MPPSSWLTWLESSEFMVCVMWPPPWDEAQSTTYSATLYHSNMLQHSLAIGLQIALSVWWLSYGLEFDSRQTQDIFISTASRYNVGTTQLCNPGLVNFKPKGGRISICTHWKGWGELESLKGCYLQTTNYADRLNDKVACRAEFNKTQRMVGSPLAVLRDESQCLNIIGWGQMVRR